MGAGLALWLAPRAAGEIRARAAGSARDLGHAVSGRYRDVRGRVAGAMDGFARKGQGLRDGASAALMAGVLGGWVWGASGRWELARALRTAERLDGLGAGDGPRRLDLGVFNEEIDQAEHPSGPR